MGIEPIRLTIRLLPNGNLEVSSPPDKILSLGMLELAKFVVAGQKVPEAPQIIIPTPIIPPMKGDN